MKKACSTPFCTPQEIGSFHMKTSCKGFLCYPLRGEELWVAVCLESFMAAQDGTLSGVISKIIHVLESHVDIAQGEGLEPFACIPPAPQEFWDKFNAATVRLMPISLPSVPSVVLPSFKRR